MANSTTQDPLEKMQQLLVDTEESIRAQEKSIQTDQSEVDYDKSQVAKLKANIKSLQTLKDETDKVVESYAKVRQSLWEEVVKLIGHVDSEMTQYAAGSSPQWAAEKAKVEQERSAYDASIASMKAEIVQLTDEVPLSGASSDSVQSAKVALDNARLAYQGATADYDTCKKLPKESETELKALQAMWQEYLKAELTSRRVAYFLLLDLAERLQDLKNVLVSVTEFTNKVQGNWTALVTATNAMAEAESTLESREKKLAAVEKRFKDAETNRKQRIIDAITHFDPAAGTGGTGGTGGTPTPSVPAAPTPPVDDPGI